MKKQTRSNAFVKTWRYLIRRRLPADDPLLRLSITDFNYSSGWDRLLRKHAQLLT